MSGPRASVYLYQGEELGLWEVEDLPADKRQDPIWPRTDGADPGRDGCRVPPPVVRRRTPVRLLTARRPQGALAPATRGLAPPHLHRQPLSVPHPLSAGDILLTSTPLTPGSHLPPDTATWIHLGP